MLQYKGSRFFQMLILCYILPQRVLLDGFSCSSSLSALSLDEPFIQKDVELRIMPPVQENDNGNETESEQPEESNETKKRGRKTH